jgi:hypothetical protein
MIYLQFSASLVIAWIYYMIAMIMTTYDGVLSMLFQPIMGAIFAFIAVLLCFIIGLPIRLIPKLRLLWCRFWWLPILLGLIGFILIAISWFPPLRETIRDEIRDIDVQTFHPTLATLGWFLSIFAVLHFWFPIPEFLQKRFGKSQTRSTQINVNL